MSLLRSKQGVTRIIGVVLASLGLAMVVHSDAAASHVSCGDTITVDTTLDSDLIDCPGNGIVIGANAITLDLGGHTVDGADPNQTNAGILLVGKSGVTITNGSVYEFYTGLEVSGISNVVRRVTVGCGQTECDADEAFGMNLTGLDADLLVTESTIVNSTTGIAIQGTNVRIEANRFLNNGLQITGTDNIVRNNLMAAGSISMIDNPGPGNLIAGNVIREGGIQALNGSFNAISENRIDGAHVGIHVIGEDAQDNVVTDNEVRRSGTGIMVTFGASQNLIARNRVLRSDSYGIQLAGIGDFSSQNQVLGNVARLSGADGIAVDSETRGTLLEQNTASRNRDDGIDVDNAETTITRNRADRNGDLGIEAVEGVIDGGGNRARGNRNREQCTGVVCR